MNIFAVSFSIKQKNEKMNNYLIQYIEYLMLMNYIIKQEILIVNKI